MCVRAAGLCVSADGRGKSHAGGGGGSSPVCMHPRALSTSDIFFASIKERKIELRYLALIGSGRRWLFALCVNSVRITQLQHWLNTKDRYRVGEMSMLTNDYNTVAMVGRAYIFIGSYIHA